MSSCTWQWRTVRSDVWHIEGLAKFRSIGSFPCFKLRVGQDFSVFGWIAIVVVKIYEFNLCIIETTDWTVVKRMHSWVMILPTICNSLQATEVLPRHLQWGNRSYGKISRSVFARLLHILEVGVIGGRRYQLKRRSGPGDMQSNFVAGMIDVHC